MTQVDMKDEYYSETWENMEKVTKRKREYANISHMKHSESVFLVY